MANNAQQWAELELDNSMTNLDMITDNTEPDYAITKLDTLQRAKEDKLARLGSTTENKLQQQTDLSGLDTYEKLTAYLQNKNAEGVNYDDAATMQEVFGMAMTYGLQKDDEGKEGFINPSTGVFSQYRGDTRGAYIGETENGQMKFGLRRGDKTYDDRYTSSLFSSYGWDSGPEGVKPEERAAHMDQNLPAVLATALEKYIHSNAGQLAERTIGQGPVTPDWDRRLGSGKTEYTNKNAPLWNMDYDVAGVKLQSDTPLPGESRARIPGTWDAEGNYVPADKESSRLANFAKGVPSTLTKAAVGVADSALEFVGKGLGDTIRLVDEDSNFAGFVEDTLDLGTKKDRDKVIDSVTGYDSKYSADAQLQLKALTAKIQDRENVEPNVVTKILTNVAESSKNVPFLNQLTETIAGVSSIIDVAEGGEVLEYVKTALSTPEVALESAGDILVMAVARGKGITARNKEIGSLRKDIASDLKANKGVDVEKAAQLKDLQAQRTMLDKGASVLSENIGVVAVSSAYVNDAADEFKAMYGRDMTYTEKLGSLLVTVPFMMMDKTVALGNIKGVQEVAAQFKKLEGAVPSQMLVQAAYKSAKAATTLGVAAVKEFLQEVPQTIQQEMLKYDMINEDFTINELSEENKAKLLNESVVAGALAFGAGAHMATPAVVAGALSPMVGMSKDKIQEVLNKDGKSKENVDTVNAEDVKFGDTKITDDEADNLRTTYRLAKEGSSVLDLADLANTATELEDYLAKNKLDETEEYVEINKSRKETYAKIIDEARLVSTVGPDATEAELEASDDSFQEVINKYGLSDKARNKLLSEYLNNVYGTMDYASMPDLDYAEVPETDAYASVPTEEAAPSVATKTTKRVDPVGLDLDDDIEYAEVPEVVLPTKPLNKNAAEAVKENIEAKKKSNKIKVEKKAEFTDEELGVGAVTEDGYTKGVSARTINRLGKMFGLAPEKVRDALDIAVPFMKVRQMKYVSKEANDVQRETYYGKDGVNPSYIEYKKAIQEGDSEKALTAIDKLRNRAIKLEEKLARHDDVVRDIKNVANAVLKRFEEGKIDADRAIDYLLLNTKSVANKYQVSAMDVMYDTLPKEIQDKVTKPEVNNGIEIANSQRETIGFIDRLLAAEGIEREVATFEEVKVADRISEYEAKVEELKTKITEQEDIVAATEDKLDKVSEVNLLNKYKKDLTKAEEVLSNYKTKYPDKEFIYRRVHTKDEQIEKETKAKIANELGKEAGTLTKEEVEEAKARGVDVKEDMVKEIQKVSDVKDIPAKVEKLKELKKKVDTVSEDYKDKETKLRDKLKVDKELARELRDENEKAYIAFKKKLDDLYSDLDKSKKSRKQVNKELKASEKAESVLSERLADTSETVDSVYRDVRDVDKEAHRYSLDYRDGKKSLKDISAVAKDVFTKLKRLGKAVKLVVLDVRRVLKNKKTEELRAELAFVDNNITNTEAAIRAVINSAQDTFDNKALVRKVATGFKRRKQLENMLFRVDNDKSGLAKEKAAKITRIWDEIRKLEKELYGTRLIDKALVSGPSDDVESASQGSKEAMPNINSKVKTVPTLFGQVDMEDLAELIEDTEAKKVYLDIVKNAVSVLSKVVPNPSDNETVLAGDTLANPASSILWDKVDGKYVMNKQVAAVIALTASEYIGTNGVGLIKNSKADIARILDKMHEWQVTKAEREMLRKGKLMVNETTSIGSQLLGSLGIKKDSTSMPIGQYAQLASSMGAHAILYAEAKGYIEDTSSAISSISATEWNATYDADTKSRRKDKKIAAGAKILKVVGKESKKKTYETLKVQMKIINEALNIEDASRDYRISPINTKNKVYKIKNGYGEVPERTQEVLKSLEDQKWRVAEDAMEEFDELLSTSDDTLRKLMGWKDVEAMRDEEIYLLDALAEQESRNTEIENSIDSLKSLRVRKNSIPKDLYFAWFFSKNGRYMLDSIGVNPQTDKKLSRFLLVPKEATEVTWDLTDEKDKLYFVSGILQGLGVELDKHSTEYILKLGEALLKKVDSSDVIDTIRDSLLLGGGKLKFGNTVFNSEHPGHTMQALAALKRYKNRDSSNRVKAVVTMEFDAKTSGFAFKLLQLPFDTTKAQAEWLEKTGIYIGDKLDSIEGKGSNDALTKIEDAYRTLGREADKKVRDMTEKPDSVDGDKFAIWPALSITKGAVENMVDDVTDAVTAFARELFKYPFMRFNYAESIESNKKSLAYELTNKTLAKIADGSLTVENSPELFAALGVKDSIALRKDLTTKELKNIRVTPANITVYSEGNKSAVVANNGKTVPIEEVLQTTFEASYGNVLQSVMSETFGHMLEANNVMIASTQIMADGFIAELNKIKDKNMTEAELLDHIKKLEKVFPIIKSPFGKSRSEGIALISSGRQPNKEWEAVTKVKGKETKTLTVQSIIREFERAQAAGAVIPTHWTDGAVIGEALLLGGILGVHDAMVLGLGGKRTEEALLTMNKAMVDISMQYNVMQNMLDALTESLNNMSDEAIMAIEPAKGMESPMEVLTALTDLTNKNNNLRAKLFGNKLASGNVVGYAGAVYYSEGSKNLNGILNDKDLRMLEATKVDVNDIVSKVEELVKGCKNG